MKRHTIFIFCIALLLPVILVAQGVVKVKKTSPSPKQGIVAFDHNIHKGKGITDCKICHHTGNTTKKCADSSCHWTTQNKGYIAIHNKCIGCHRTKGGKAPTMCAQCHKR